MRFFLQQEKQLADEAYLKCRVVRNLNNSKSTRLKHRFKKLLLSRRGLSTAFVLGLVKGASEESEKSSKKSHVARAARIGLTSYLG